MNPLFEQFGLLWNSSFIRYELGNATYNRLFGGEPNYVIIKVDSINDVANVVNQVNDIINPYPRFVVWYNQALIDSLISFQSQTAPLYYALDIIALIAAIAVTALLANISAGRRIWEAGLFIAQGWLWNNVYRLYYFYFLILSISGFALSLISSIIISHFLVFRYIVYGTTLPIQLVISPVFVSMAFILAIAIPFLSSFIALRKFRRNIDRMLAEY
jgi:ABC-type antimicrobial peptide transport system permease subunit